MKPLIILTAIALIALWLSIPVYVQPSFEPHALEAGNMFYDAMHYHPAPAPVYDSEIGTWVFYRDGKRCQLFTVRFFEKMDYPREW